MRMRPSSPSFDFESETRRSALCALRSALCTLHSAAKSRRMQTPSCRRPVAANPLVDSTLQMLEPQAGGGVVPKP